MTAIKPPAAGTAQITGAVGPEATDRPSSSGAGNGMIERYGLIGLFAILVIVLSFLRPETFPTYANFRSIAISQSVLAVAALALIAPLIGGRFDISVGANLGISSMVAAAAMQNYALPLPVAVLAGVATGALVGLANGILVAYLGVNAIIGTLGVSIVLQGLVQAYTGGIPISARLDPALTGLSVQVVGRIPVLFIIMIAVAIATWFVLRQTSYGRYLQAVGSNLRAARLTGIPARRIVLISFLLSGTLAGVAGVLQIAAQGNADPTVGGITFILPALAAAFLGATTWKPGTYNVVGTIIGLYFLGVVISGLSLLGVQPWVTDVFNGAAVIAAIVFSAQFKRRRTGTMEIGG